MPYDRKTNQDYLNGWIAAERDHADLIPYDPDRQPEGVWDPVQIDAFITGYYEFWKDKNFSLDD